MADLTLTAGIDAQQFESGITRLEEQMKRLGTSTQGVGKDVLGWNLAYTAVNRSLRESVDLVREYGRANDTVGRQLDRMGRGWAGLTRGIGRDISGLLPADGGAQLLKDLEQYRVGVVDALHDTATGRMQLYDDPYYSQDPARPRYKGDGEAGGDVDAARREEERQTAVQKLIDAYGDSYRARVQEAQTTRELNDAQRAYERANAELTAYPEEGRATRDEMLRSSVTAQKAAEEREAELAVARMRKETEALIKSINDLKLGIAANDPAFERLRKANDGLYAAMMGEAKAHADQTLQLDRLGMIARGRSFVMDAIEGGIGRGITRQGLLGARELQLQTNQTRLEYLDLIRGVAQNPDLSDAVKRRRIRELTTEMHSELFDYQRMASLPPEMAHPVMAPGTSFMSGQIFPNAQSDNAYRNQFEIGREQVLLQRQMVDLLEKLNLSDDQRSSFWN